MKGENRCLGLSLVLVFALLVSISFANLVMAESSLSFKIGVVDINKIMRESKAAKNARAIYQKDLESKKAIIKEKRDRVANLEKDVKNTNQKSPAWKEKSEKLAQEFKELKRLGSDLDEQLKKKDAELTQKIFVDIQQIINKLMSSENYSLIMEKKSLLAASDGLDITDKIIKIYDAQR